MWLYTFRRLINPSRPMINVCHDDVIKWKHFPRYRPFVRGIHRSPVNSPHKGQWRGPVMFTLICVWINDWVNNREAGDLRRYRAHYDVTLMASVNLVSLGSDNVLPPVWRRATTWSNLDLSIRHIGTNFSQIGIEKQNFSFVKTHLKMSFAKWRSFCPEEDELNTLLWYHTCICSALPSVYCVQDIFVEFIHFIRIKLCNHILVSSFSYRLIILFHILSK